MEKQLQRLRVLTKETITMSENKTNLTPEQALDLHRDLYRPDYRGYHHRAIVCLGLIGG